ncbi:MAG: exodeoxyribonuclease VII small subunit [Minisyncoccia bacterium]
MDNKYSLKDALKKLELIVNDLSKKDVDIDEGLDKFKQGVELVKFCRQELQKAENEFEKIKAELENNLEVNLENDDKNLDWDN